MAVGAMAMFLCLCLASLRIALALAISAVQLLPAIELAAQGQRSDLGIASGLADAQFTTS